MQDSGFTAQIHHEDKPSINQDNVTVVPPGTTVVVPGAAAVDVVKGSGDSVFGSTTVATGPTISSPYSSLTGYDSAYFNQDDLTFISNQSKPSNEGGALAAGTEHVKQVVTGLKGLAGVIMSVPAGALEALSPTAATKTNEGMKFVSSKISDITIQAESVADTATKSLPNGIKTLPVESAVTYKTFSDAAVHKAQEILTPSTSGIHVA